MRIKRIEIIGFKSFCDKTVLTIDEPITAVVGPNGCGKSNIVDAIRWCMGEQSAKHLRGKAMEDVIFAGSESRGAGSMAEVSLTFENVGYTLRSVPPEDAAAGEDEDEDVTEEQPAIDFTKFGEVTVTRRLFRDETSEYYINRTPCRLRDVQDFFLGTGVGTKAYAIIEQGRIGMIVSAKPEERRLIIEEAAGITKFKKKKQAAERKMEQTRQNLLRVSDVAAEIEKQLGSLRRQAQKAERYKKYRAEVRDIELWAASHRVLGLWAEEKVEAVALGEVAEKRDAAHAEHEKRDAAVVSERAECALEERRLAELTQVAYDLESRIRLGESRRDFQRREAGELDERCAQARGEIESVEHQLSSVREEIGRTSVTATELELRANEHGRELETLEEKQRAAKARLQDGQAELDEARREISVAQADIARAENNEAALGRRRSDLEQRVGRLADEKGRIDARQAELAHGIGTLDEKLGGLRQTRLDLGDMTESLEQRLAELKEQQAAGEAEVETLRTELHRRRSRLQSLREIEERYEGFARGTRAVMQHRPGDPEGVRIRGLVADIVESPPEFEPAVEAVLGDRLGSILVESQDVGVLAIDFLKQRAEGRSTFIPMQQFAASTSAVSQEGAIAVVEAAGVRGPMLEFVRCRDGYSRVAEWLLGDVLLVESLDRALALFDQGLRRTMVTLDGDVVDAHGVVTGGSRETAGAGVLTQKREIRELADISQALEADLADATARHVACKAELQKVGKALDAIRKDAHQGELTIVSHEKDLARLGADAERVSERRSQIERERAEVEGQLSETGREAESTALALDGARRRAAQAETRQLGLIEGVTSARGALEEVSALVTDSKVQVAQVGAERAGVKAQLSRLAGQETELAQRMDRLGRTISESGQRAQALRQEADALSQELVGLREEHRARVGELAESRQAYDRRMAELQVAEAEARAVRTDAERAAAEAQKLEMKLHDLAAEMRHILEGIDERYRLDVRGVLCEYHLRAPVGPAEEARLKELRDLIERMGEINLTAIEEYETLAKRYEFLSGQKQDLESALGQLETAIAKINRTSRKLFKETFEAVNAKFQEVFPRLFRGGRAELRLAGNEDDLLEAGVEIFAQPPGKKNVTVDLLSGGEKALTAVALIFAIFLIKPSPFCLLDEVDAPLDEANVGRYNELIREMTDRSQFIVITHNKRTMQVADALYGVTMEEPGCSKLVSVSLRGLDQRARAA